MTLSGLSASAKAVDTVLTIHADVATSVLKKKTQRALRTHREKSSRCYQNSLILELLIHSLYDASGTCSYLELS